MMGLKKGNTRPLAEKAIHTALVKKCAQGGIFTIPSL